MLKECSSSRPMRRNAISPFSRHAVVPGRAGPSASIELTDQGPQCKDGESERLQPRRAAGGHKARVAVAYRSRPTKRRSQADMERIRIAIHDAVAEDHPMTVRQVFYQLVS